MALMNKKTFKQKREAALSGFVKAKETLVGINTDITKRNLEIGKQIEALQAESAENSSIFNDNSSTVNEINIILGVDPIKEETNS